MRALIIDDERLARQELRALLGKYPEIEIVAECANAPAALHEIENHQPDVLFLDIQMPEMNGFELLAKLSFVPAVVFITAFDDFAIKAFEVNAFDYLLKPVLPKRLDETIIQLIAVEKGKEKDPAVKGGVLSLDDKVFVKDGERCWFVKLSEIRLFESEGNYVRVYFEKNKPLILKSLNSLEERLDPKMFFRASRKHILNLSWVEGMETWFNGGLMAALIGGEKVEISRRQASRFKDLMSL
jgi:two-component system, LytTR family, response regulator